MLDYTRTDLIVLANQLLDRHPDPIPRFRLLRDVLQLSPHHADFSQARAAVDQSRWIRLLCSSCRPDGTWGRFHTRDSRLKVPFPTTEIAVRTALDSGLDATSDLLQNVQRVLEDYILARSFWPDPFEKHDNPDAWLVWMRHYSAAVLSEIDPSHPLLEEYARIWAGIVQATFESGFYDRRREIQAANDLLRCRMKDPVPFHYLYPLLLLSTTNHPLPVDLQDRLLDFVLNHPRGIYYVIGKPVISPPPMQSREFPNWMRAHRLLSRFSHWPQMAQPVLNWLWNQRLESGGWDFGPNVVRKPYSCFPLSEDWRSPDNRLIDCSALVLSLLVSGLPQDRPVE